MKLKKESQIEIELRQLYSKIRMRELIEYLFSESSELPNNDD